MTTIEEVLAEERKHNTLDIEGLAQFLYTSDDLAEFRAAMDRKNLPYDYNIFNKSRAELIKESFRIWPEALKDARNTAKVSIATAAYSLGYYHQLPGTIHKAMFMKCIDLLGTDYQRQEYLPKC